ncbi:MAG: hypothetical protein KAT68_14615 [Bacteroidales bacterium]|nr:hypothetical protein [Bacteroidales bacterium]
MKKAILLLSIIFVLIYSLTAQNAYQVIKVTGTIKIVESGVSLSQGISFDDDNNLDFITTNARAAVIHPSKGRFILMPNNSNIAYARANLTPSMSNISSRAGAMISKVDLSNFFSGDYVIIDKSYIKISPNIFIMDNDNFFYIKYTYKDEDIHKKLKYSNDTLIINKSELFTIDGWPITNPNITKMELLYMSKEKGGSIYINSFNPVFPDSKELLSEIEVILKNFKDKSKEEIINELVNYINEMYGKIDQTNVEKWLIDNNKI